MWLIGPTGLLSKKLKQIQLPPIQHLNSEVERGGYETEQSNQGSCDPMICVLDETIIYGRVIRVDILHDNLKNENNSFSLPTHLVRLSLTNSAMIAINVVKLSWFVRLSYLLCHLHL